MKVSIFTAQALLASTAALFAEAGLDLEAMLKLNDKTSLAAHLESVRVAAASPMKITAELPEVAALITAASATAVANAVTAALAQQKSEFHAQAVALLAGCGVKLAADAKPENFAADIKPALEAHINIRAREILSAKTGTDFVEEEPEAGAGDTKVTAGLTGRDALKADFADQLSKLNGASGRN